MNEITITHCVRRHYNQDQYAEIEKNVLKMPSTATVILF